jgi:hypothetical protein
MGETCTLIGITVVVPHSAILYFVILFSIIGAEGVSMNNDKELYWVSAHQDELEPYAGKWVAILGEAIVGVGNTAQEALDNARQKSAETPFLIKVPRKDEGLYVL